MEEIQLNVNEQTHRLRVPPDAPLLQVLRNDLGLKAAKFGCGLEQCGACKVLIDGRAMPSCATRVADVARCEITTLEGLGTLENPHPLQRAFIAEQAAQCGYCTAGLIVAAKALLDRTPRPTRKEICRELDSISDEALLRYPALANLFIHPRILGIVSAILNDDNLWLWQLKTNRYTPEHPGVGKHTDSFPGEISPPFTRQAIAVFLDDISVGSGALTYVPGTHKLHYEDPADSSRQAPSKEDIEAGNYIPAVLKAGSVLFRVPEVWHAVIPIHHLRRYVTGSYATRGKVSPMMAEKIKGVSEKRAQVPPAEIPAEFRTILSY